MKNYKYIKLTELILLLGLAAFFPIISLKAAALFFILLWFTASFSFDWRLGNFLLFNFEVFSLFKAAHLLSIIAGIPLESCASGVFMICGLQIAIFVSGLRLFLCWFLLLVFFHGLLLLFARKLKDKFNYLAIPLFIIAILPLVLPMIFIWALFSQTAQ